MQNFRRHMEASPNVILHVGELTYGDRPFEVTTANHPTDYQWRTQHELWHKENLINLIVQRFPSNWQYGGYIDGDFHLTRYDWALEAVHLLQHYDWIQLFSRYQNLGYNHEPLREARSFSHRYVNGELNPKTLTPIAEEGSYAKANASTGKRLFIGATGGAWAFRRKSFDAVGGMLDVCALGSGDEHIAYGLAGKQDLQETYAPELLYCSSPYANAIKTWQRRAAKVVNKNIGCMDCYAVHHYHGDKSYRGYAERWKILRDHKFDPHIDLYKDSQGVYQLTSDKPQLRDEIRRYFRSRNEDR